MKKPIKILLGILSVSAVVGLCFLCLTIYAKKEMSKPKFKFPETVEDVPATELPKNSKDTAGYVIALYEKALRADDVEGSSKTTISIAQSDKINTPLSSSDEAVFSRMLRSSEGMLGEMYPENENVLMTKAKDFPVLGFTGNDVTDFTAETGYIDDYGEAVDDGFYYITLEINPKCIDTNELKNSEVRKNIENELSSAMKVSSFDIEAQSFQAVFKIAYYNDMLVSVELRQNLLAEASVDFINEYASLCDETANITVPYEKVTEIDFMHYGIHFTSRQIAVNKDDMQAVPLEVRVNGETTQDEFRLTFDVSTDGILDIDEDGVMTVVGTSEKPVTVKAKLEYAGHTYEDTLTVYATELEVSEDE